MTVIEYLEQYNSPNIKRVILRKNIWFLLHKKSIEEWKEKIITTDVRITTRYILNDATVKCFASEKFNFVSPYGLIEFIKGN